MIELIIIICVAVWFYKGTNGSKKKKFIAGGTAVLAYYVLVIIITAVTITGIELAGYGHRISNESGTAYADGFLLMSQLIGGIISLTILGLIKEKYFKNDLQEEAPNESQSV